MKQTILIILIIIFIIIVVWFFLSVKKNAEPTQMDLGFPPEVASGTSHQDTPKLVSGPTQLQWGPTAMTASFYSLNEYENSKINYSYLSGFLDVKNNLNIPKRIFIDLYGSSHGVSPHLETFFLTKIKNSDLPKLVVLISWDASKPGVSEKYYKVFIYNDYEHNKQLYGKNSLTFFDEERNYGRSDPKKFEKAKFIDQASIESELKRLSY